MYFSFASQSNVGQIAHLQVVTQGSSSFPPLTLQNIKESGGLCGMWHASLLLTSIGPVLIPGPHPISLRAQEEVVVGGQKLVTLSSPCHREGEEARQVLGGHDWDLCL